MQRVGSPFHPLILLLLFFYCVRVVRYIRRVRELRRGTVARGVCSDHLDGAVLWRKQIKRLPEKMYPN